MSYTTWNMGNPAVQSVTEVWPKLAQDDNMLHLVHFLLERLQFLALD